METMLQQQKIHKHETLTNNRGNELAYGIALKIGR